MSQNKSVPKRDFSTKLEVPSKKFKKADTEEKRKLQRLLGQVTFEKEEVRSELRASQEIAKKIDEEKNSLKKQLDENNNILAKIKIALEGETSKEDVQDSDSILIVDTTLGTNFTSTKVEQRKEKMLLFEDDLECEENSLKRHDLLVKQFISSLHFGLHLSEAECDEENKLVLDEVEDMFDDFDINKTFKHMEDEQHAFFYFNNMEIFALPKIYWVVRALNKDGSFEKVEESALDEGGPARDFFSKIWKNLELLSLHYQVPTDDDKIQDSIYRIIKYGNYRYDSILDRVKKYYKAVGIMLFFCVIHQIPVASHVMPNFYRNVLLRNVEPKDKLKYSKRQMLIQFAEIGTKFMDRDENSGKEFLMDSANDILGKSLKWLLEQGIIPDIGDNDENKIINLNNFFTIYLQTKIKNQSIAINALKEGLSLEGRVCLYDTLFLVPLSYVSETFFTTSNIEADELLERLIYNDDVELYEFFFDSVLKEVIMEMTPEERKDFLFFCTGYNFLPLDDNSDSEDFQIDVEFDSELGAASLPESHTCEKTLVLPEEAYGNDKGIFKEKLFQAMAHSKAGTMI